MLNDECYKMNGDYHKTNDNIQGKEYHVKRKAFIEAICKAKKVIWNKKQKDISMEKFMDTVRNKYGVNIDTYWDLHKWSIQNIGQFWEEIFKDFDIIHSEPYTEVLPPYKEIIGIEWFRGLKFNYAENALRYRDEHVALLCLDEEGREKTITYAELFEEVKRYAAAFRRHGLKTGDKVACYMSQREEAVIGMLACASIGGIWGGLVPFYGPKAAASSFRLLNPKFLLTIDKFVDNKTVYNILPNLKSIVNGITSIEKVIIVTTEEKTLKTDISEIQCSCFLDDFLESGVHAHSSDVTDLKFEQLPFNHTLSINFTSGTTGNPKGLAHPAGVLLTHLVNSGLHCSSTRDDVLFSLTPCGWGVWSLHVSTLALGSTLVLYCGNPLFLSHTSVWDIMAKYKVTQTFILNSLIDKMEKLNIVPGPSCDLSNLRMFLAGGGPVKLNNFDFLHQRVKEDMFVGSLYGCTELSAGVSGFYLNSPAYSGEIQGITLGVDLRIFDSSGNSVIGQLGDVVICSPLPNFSLYLLNDETGERIRSTYMSKFPGVWSLNDEGWIDPETNGLVILGRCDEVFNPQEEIFGPCDIYFAIHDMEEITDSLCVAQNSSNGSQRVVLFVKLSPTTRFTEDLVQKISKKIEHDLTLYHVPQVILETKEIPISANGKKMEKLVSRILDTNVIPEFNNSRNPQCLESFRNIPELQGF